MKIEKVVEVLGDALALMRCGRVDNARKVLEELEKNLKTLEPKAH